MNNNLKVSEVFESLQGEGSTTGQRVLFIRLSGCNLRCSFCDTKYHTQSRNLTKADDYLLKNNRHWVITGGEPLLQQAAIVELIEDYGPDMVEVETNGTIKELTPRFLTSIDLFNISPKDKRFQPKECNSKPIFLEYVFEMGSAHYNVKFVYSDKESERFISNIIKKYHINPESVWIMPEAATKEELEKKQKKVWEYCVKHSYNYSPRLQVIVFGKKRGK